MTTWRNVARGFIAFTCAVGFSVSAFAADPAKPDAPKPEVTKFGSWYTSCTKDEKGEKACYVFVDVRAGEKKAQVAYIGIGHAISEKEKGKFGMFAITPLGTLLAPGFKVNVDGKNIVSNPFLFCVEGGCRTDTLLSDDDIKALKGGKEMEVVFSILRSGEVKIPLKLDGMTAAINSLPKAK